MCACIIRRLLLTFPTLFIVSFVIFVVIRFMPGDIVDAEISRCRRSAYRRHRWSRPAASS